MNRKLLETEDDRRVLAEQSEQLKRSLGDNESLRCASFDWSWPICFNYIHCSKCVPLNGYEISNPVMRSYFSALISMFPKVSSFGSFRPRLHYTYRPREALGL